MKVAHLVGLTLENYAGLVKGISQSCHKLQIPKGIICIKLHVNYTPWKIIQRV